MPTIAESRTQLNRRAAGPSVRTVKQPPVLPQGVTDPAILERYNEDVQQWWKSLSFQSTSRRSASLLAPVVGSVLPAAVQQAVTLVVREIINNETTVTDPDETDLHALYVMHWMGGMP